MNRVLFFMPTSAVIGGVETWLDKAVTHLQQNGFDPVVGLMRGCQYNQPERFKKYHPGLKCVEVDGRGLDQFGRVQALLRCVRSVAPDVVVPLGVADAYEAVALGKQEGLPVRLVAQTQGNLPAILADIVRFQKWIDLVVCPGRLAMEVLIQWGNFDRDRLRHVPNGADAAYVQHVSRKTNQPLRLGYVGRMTRNDKRVLDVIKLVRELLRRDVPFTLELVGDGPCRGELEACLRDHDNVTFHGARQHQELYDTIFPNLDILLLFSASEAFGIVLLEAMLHGVVPVTSEFLGFHAEGVVLKDKTCLSFPIADTAAAAHHVETLAQSPDQLKSLSQAAAAHAQKFSWEICLNGWSTALQEATQREATIGESSTIAFTKPTPSRLTQLGLSAQMIDRTRRLKRSLFGPAVPPGGEEWPLFHKDHSPAALQEIQHCVETIEQRMGQGQLAGFEVTS